MAEASLEYTQDAFEAQRPNARFAGDSRLYVRFFMNPTRDEQRSLEEGRPIYVEREFVEIRIPGDKDNVVVRPVRDMDRERFRDRYEQFRRGEIQTTEGTPLEAWPAVSRAEVEELKHFRVFTVEQLAEMPDSIAQRFVGIQRLKAVAKDFILTAKDSSHLQQMRAELEQRDNEIQTLQNTVKELADRIAAQEKKAK